MISPPPICIDCKYYNREDMEKFSCQSFPEGIPGKIILGEFIHTEPYPDADNPQDNGIRFEPIKDTE